jgi:multiple sugar transport system permease protein|tara:strand:+ start:2718 stop:3566 length:849 start_codon:yes stop_codon:yes gene_type:complete
MRKYSYKTFITILWSFLTLMTLIPIYWMVLVSTKTPVELFGKPDLSPTFFDKIYWKNYTRPFIDGVYSEYLFNSIVIATSNAVLITILALMATYALSRFNLAASDNIFFWTMTNRMAPPVAFLLPLFLLFSTVFRIGDHSLFDTKIGLILLYSIFNLPFAIWLLKGIIDGIPKELDEAMVIDGANLFTIFHRLIIPLAAPGIAVTALLSFLFAWNEYLLASTLSSVYARTIPTGLSEFVTTTGTNWGMMAAVAVVSMLPALLFLVLVQKYIVAGLTFGAIKG